MRTPFLFQQKLKLAAKDWAGERTFPVHTLNWIFSVQKMYLAKLRASGDHFLSYQCQCSCLLPEAIPPHLLRTGPKLPFADPCLACLLTWWANARQGESSLLRYFTTLVASDIRLKCTCISISMSSLGLTKQIFSSNVQSTCNSS